NPVGVGAMALASGLSITAHLGVFGPLAQAFSALIALGTAFVAAPIIAWATRGKYYLARPAQEQHRYQRMEVRRCVICEREYEGPDMAHCPAYQGPICSLCCTLDARCGDLCKPQASLASQWSAVLRWVLPARSWRYLDTGLGHFLLLTLIVVPLLAAVFGVLYQQELRALADAKLAQEAQAALRSGFLKAYMALLVIAGIVAWWLVLAHQSRKVAQEESNRQTHLLMREIELHRETDRALQAAKQSADAANQAKSRYISAISHELRTPLNSILGYAQLMGEDTTVPPHRRQAVAVIKRGGEHLLSLIEGTLDIAHIEAGKLTLNAKPMRFAETMQELADMFELQAEEKGLEFRYAPAGSLPELVRADEKRVRQILINLLGNAIKFTARGHVSWRIRYAREFAALEIEDTGPGMSPEEIARVFEPFARGASAGQTTTGAGLGLTIAKMLTDLMGGEMSVQSTPGCGTVFQVRLFVPRVHEPVTAAASAGRATPQTAPRLAVPRRGYEGPRRRVLVVDNEEADRQLLQDLLEPLGFDLRTAASGHDALDLLAAGLRPDAMFVDLAMPGIDGWETIRRARKLGLAGTAVAIVSANAFDKRLENDVGITPEDFLVKPVRHSELLDWLEQRLQLRWTSEPATAKPTGADSPPLVRPAPEQVRLLEEAVSLGYLRGIMNQLDEIERLQPECGPWADRQRAMARQFQLDALSRSLAELK
ncbi:MAG TPA: ATP-binding protein, partial [Variovorax sp.]|nr:ATP-binding protein [Variovorax sp.]